MTLWKQFSEAWNNIELPPKLAKEMAEAIDELKENLKEAISLCVEEGDPIILGEYIGTEQLEVMI